MRAITLLLCVLCLGLFTSCESRKTIVNGLDEKEANEILVFLSSKRIDAQKVKSAEGQGAGQKIVLWDINVKEDEGREAMSLLNQNGLPRRKGQTLLNIFANTGLVPSEMQDKIRYQAGLAETLASTIRKIDGILDSEVQISFPEEDPLNPGATKGKITASVYVKHSGVLDDPNSHLLSRIKSLVSSSITGLSYDNVTVIPDRARFSENPTGTIQGTYDQEKEYVNIWSIILAKESVTRFRVIFFTFVFLLLFLTLSLVWMGWKIHPILAKQGGIKSLLHLHPLEKEETPVEEAKPKSDETAETVDESDKASLKDKIKKGQDAIEGARNKDVDET